MAISIIVRAGGDVKRPSTLNRKNIRGLNTQRQVNDTAEHEAVARITQCRPFIGEDIVAVLRHCFTADFLFSPIFLPVSRIPCGSKAICYDKMLRLDVFEKWVTAKSLKRIGCPPRIR